MVTIRRLSRDLLVLGLLVLLIVGCASTPSRWDPPARVEFSLGEAVYRSNDASVMAVRADWSGHATFSDLPLVRGEGYEGRAVIRLLEVAWDCTVRN